MVYQDIQADNPDDQKQKIYYSPVLLDRFFSFLIDYMVFSPFVSFFSYFLFKDAILFWKANPEAPEEFSLIAILAISVIFMFSLMQATFIYAWGATPGQFFLKIRVRFDSEPNFIFGRALLRQIGFWSTPVFLGLPWLAMLSHPQRKTFYDRLADCELITPKRSESFSFESEFKYWRSLLATMIIFVGFLFATVVWLKYEKIVQRVSSFEKMQSQKFFCEDLKNIQVTQRLSMAVAMNVVGQLSNDCLDREADFALWKDKKSDLSLAYFAKSLTETDENLQTQYLTQACSDEDSETFKEKSFGCQLAQSSLTGDYEKMYVALQVRDGLLADTYKYEFSRELHKTEEIQRNFMTLQKYDEHRLVKKYLLKEMLNNQSSEGTRMPASDSTGIYDPDVAAEWVNDL